MLLGAEIYSQILQNGFKKAPDGSTVAQATSLGWILSGTVTSASQNTSNITVMHTQLGDDEILKKFWELEREPNHIKKHLLTEEESRCEEIFKATTTREKDGRYVVNLPFKSEDPSCQYGDTKKAAIKRFYTLETKFAKDTQLKEKYADVTLKHYKLLTVTFGTSSAPFLAVRSMQQVAYDEGIKYPFAAERVLKDYYMDDLMTGCDTIEEGMQIYNQMNELLAKAGFTLQKWSSNSSELLEKMIGKRYSFKGQQNVEKEISIKQDEVFKTLGLTWNRTCDTFQYSVQLPALQEPVTKRKILSDIARLFDPLGWVAPVIIVAKMLIQKLWISGIAWDEEVPCEIKKEWLTYRQELHFLTKFSVPRWLHMKHGDKQIDLHGFCDASKSAYAAVVYARVVDADGGIHVNLLTAKTKVAPIKTVSVPRLELCGAVLLAKLLSEVSEVMGISKSNLYYWTDSEIVLAWLNCHPNKWKTFVANRVSEILCISEPQQWNHVQSKSNPADCASRGLYASDFLNFKLWLEGPRFLKDTNIIYSKHKAASTDVEAIKVHVVSEDNFIWDKYSSLTRLVRIVAYLRRPLELRKPKPERNNHTFITAEELKLALETCIKICQDRNFEEVILDLKKEKPKRKEFKSLNLYLDSVNILRVGGRLERSGLARDCKNPILIPSNSHFTNLLIADAHDRNLHGGPQVMLNYLSTKYYIQGAKRLVTACVRKCVTCLRYTASTKPQLMGQLPPARVTPNRPFKSSGVDFAGPINLRTSKGRGHHAYKGYICLFVCMATKAVHIEAVSDLTTNGFLAAFRRFVARRGHCTDMWSDNGTNFQGACRELDTLLRSENSKLAKDIAASLAGEGTTWHFIPPHAPNFGGLWESGIKSCKRHLNRVIGSSTLTFEEMATLLSQVEACLNSRPLYRLTDSNKFDALTPGHFLVGEPITSAPDRNYEDANISSLKRWHLVQQMTQHFWRRWSSEYLTTLFHRYKWSTQNPEPNIGDVVLIKEDNLPPCRWLLGRVVEKHPGLDNLTRVVTIRSNGSMLKRPTSKLCVLPVA
ncbi:uncharacterized protein LOC111355253 [Spodoptera litura]|uniref:Uncharacterized protein LOC111355253 n=1 Tax=Spodoptera litura TaxID=69820 RepID=A0A9J7E9R1_SPOLT|nr:uncharacterized protein LOC111355253 [Spodoptera litura]